MAKFIEFEIEETNTEIKLYAKLEDGSLIHVRNYDYLYEGDYRLYQNEEGDNELYCYRGVSYRIHDGKLFEYIQDRDGIGQEWEVTLSMISQA